MEKKLILKNVKLLFVELDDKDFGSSITIDVTNDDVRKEIEQFYSSNNLTPKFKDYTNKETNETTKQLSFKIAPFSKILDSAGNEYNIEDVKNKTREIKFARGAEISIVARIYDYNNKFGKGTSSSVSAIKIEKDAEIKDDMEDLL